MAKYIYGGIDVKKKQIVLNIVLGILAISIFFVANAKESAIKDPTFNESIEASHHLLRHWFTVDVNDFENLTSDYLSTSIWPENYSEGMYNTIREHATSDMNKYADWLSSKVNDDRIKTDALRAMEFFCLAGKNKDFLALGYSYMIYHDLDVQLNNYDSNYGLFGVTDFQGVGGQKYDEMIRYYNKIKNYIDKHRK